MQNIDAPNDMEWPEIVNRMKSNDLDAFRRFAASFGPAVRSYYRLQRLRPDVAEDLACDCVTDMALKISQYRGESTGSLYGWIRTGARNKLIDYWRRRGNEWETALRNDLPSPASAPDDGEARPACLAVRNALLQLPPKDRDIIWLRIQETLSFNEIGQELQMTGDNARQHYGRALRRLRTTLEQDKRVARILPRTAPPAGAMLNEPQRG